ncbi:MAG: hypothetical protein ACKVY0_03095 [Prosthecobacter sp.]|uniref:hypothetical protein n=1 Tax=Prosthecobacter sp. TaxID=1965333 RepID=UPI003901FDE6
MKKYRIRLTPEERAELETFVAKGNGAVTKRQHAHILLAAAATGPNGECLDEEIVRVLSVSISTIDRVAFTPVPESAHRKQGTHGNRGHGLGNPAKQRPVRHRLEIHDKRCTYQTQASLPSSSDGLNH